jgi:enoyl-CoA hydratase/carnithine racemase
MDKKTFETVQLKLEEDTGILTVTLYRPSSLNAFTLKMGEELVEIFGTWVPQDDRVR